jgi:hypothetical protein
MKKCHSCKKELEFTDEVIEPALLQGKMRIKRDIEWKDMMLTVFVKNREDEYVLLCRGCIASAVSR